MGSAVAEVAEEAGAAELPGWEAAVVVAHAWEAVAAHVQAAERGWAVEAALA